MLCLQSVIIIVCFIIISKKKLIGWFNYVIKYTCHMPLYCVLCGVESLRENVSTLLPQAQQRKCSWPYLAVPLTAASSIGVILPTASVTMAVVHDLANLKPDVTVLPGILTKVAAMLVLVLGANTIGSVLLGWTIPIDVARYGLNASDLFTVADEEHGV